jgi:hypothetical protein
MILKRLVFIEAIGASPVDAYLFRAGSLHPLSLRPDTLDAPQVSLDDDAAAKIARVAEIEAVAPAVRTIEAVSATVDAVAERVEAVAPFIAAQAKLIDRTLAPADLERFRRDAAELDRQRALFPQPT